MLMLVLPGLPGHPGQSVLLPVEVDREEERESVYREMAQVVEREILRKLKIVTLKVVQVGVSGVLGVTAVNHVEVDLEKERENVS